MLTPTANEDQACTGAARRRAFDGRRFVALMMLACGLGMPVTGVANHLYQREAMGLPRHAWMAAHNLLGVLFALCAIGHVVAHRRALWRHCRGLVSRLGGVRREALLAGVVLAAVLALGVGHAFLAHGG